RPAAQPGYLLAAPPGALLSLFRHVHRPHQPGPPGGRGPGGNALRTGSRLPADAGWFHRPTLAGGPPDAQPAGGHHRQHPPRRILHRQALRPRHPRRAPGHPRVSRLRDAAPPPHGAGAGVAAALPGGALLEDSLPTAPGALGYAAPRPLHAAPLRVAGHRRRGGGSQPPRLPLPARLAAALRGIPLSPLRAPGARRYPP